MLPAQIESPVNTNRYHHGSPPAVHRCAWEVWDQTAEIGPLKIEHRVRAVLTRHTYTAESVPFKEHNPATVSMFNGGDRAQSGVTVEVNQVRRPRAIYCCLKGSPDVRSPLLTIEDFKASILIVVDGGWACRAGNLYFRVRKGGIKRECTAAPSF